ncbi:protein phosphatase CheZ [Paraferrimonas sp. SM1919]|uniref:protein phosphatase CheZ n=1 Tax=Paraferrimonas sp. SM1919 TaxID=2662263 RepID=UPI0013CF8F99|nr:protein phosphatase CheZ [Paraferrimonas sp. SM1919]
MEVVETPISLDKAKELVELLEEGQEQLANQLFNELAHQAHRDLFVEVGKLTRQLHDALQNFHIDNRLIELTSNDLPDAEERLSYVMRMTEQAANKTMDAVEESLPLADNIHSGLQQILPSWQNLMDKNIQLDEFKKLCFSLDDLLKSSSTDSAQIRNLLNEVLMAQDFQDLTGQTITRVIDLVKEVELSLVGMLKVFGNQVKVKQVITDNIAAEGPIVNPAMRGDVVNSQNDVDDLLSSLGF